MCVTNTFDRVNISVNVTPRQAFFKLPRGNIATYAYSPKVLVTQMLLPLHQNGKSILVQLDM